MKTQNRFSQIQRSIYFILAPALALGLVIAGLIILPDVSALANQINPLPSEQNGKTAIVSSSEWQQNNLLALAATQSYSVPTFTAYSFGDGQMTQGLAVGDLNGDGFFDIVQGNKDQQSFVYLNDGQGGLDTWLPFGNSRNTDSVAIGDLNGDGALDIVQGNNGQQSLIYQNDGAGHFDVARPLNTSIYNTKSVAIGDLNGDGALDIIQGNDGQQSIIYLNDGFGNFDVIWPLDSIAYNTKSVAVGDLNGDGWLDIVLGNRGQFSKYYLNNGDGTFGGGINIGNPSSYLNVVTLGDLNGDGALEILQGFVQINSAGGNRCLIFWNDGAGNFGTGEAFGTSMRGSSLAVGDLNGDGYLDIVQGNMHQYDRYFLNDGAGNFDQEINFGGTAYTNYLLLADLNADGALDIVTANQTDYGMVPQAGIVYQNNGEGGFRVGDPIGVSQQLAYNIAVGDLNQDGSLDLVIGNGTGQNVKYGVIFINNGSDEFGTEIQFGDDNYWASIALGDMDDDGDLDIVQGTGGESHSDQSLIFWNDGQAQFLTNTLVGNASSKTTSVVVGDLNGDGSLDIVQGRYAQTTLVYFNNAGQFGASEPLTGTYQTQSIALGDMNGDGTLDIIQGNYDQPSYVYFNNGQGNFDTQAAIGKARSTVRLAVGDLDGDGTLDIVQGNIGGSSYIYWNDGQGSFEIGNQAFVTIDGVSAALIGDLNGDGASDLVFERRHYYLNNGNGEFRIMQLQDMEEVISPRAFGDLNGDGALDIIYGGWFVKPLVMFNTRQNSTGIPNQAPRIAVSRPGSTGNANFFSTPDILAGVIPITYTLSDPDDHPVNVRAVFSLDGGGNWLPAVPTHTKTTNLIPSAPDPVFYWDTFASGVFGQSDNVFFRIEAYPTPFSSTVDITGTYRYTNTMPLYQFPYASATTFPFRVRGTQVRVYSETVMTGNEAVGAMVYRLPDGWLSKGYPLGNEAGIAYQTDAHGYLKGRGQIETGDHLIAMLPITSTESYTIYHTSAVPITTGLETYTVEAAGVQTLTVSIDNPLILFKLDVSLEWDARNDQIYLDQLVYDLQRTSEILFDWTDGQAALGEINIYHDRGHWNDADVRIYASNRLRPNANQGGVVSQVFTETVTISTTQVMTYTPGIVRMAVTWNRYGDSGGELGEDWPRTLAHELGHYLFFLDDNYLGFDADGTLMPVDSCTGAMSNPYSDDDESGYDEFHPAENWLPGCTNTLSHHATGRSDWATINRFYTLLEETGNSGPNNLPLALTQIRFQESDSPAATLDAPIFSLRKAEGGRYQANKRARAILFQDDRLIDLGRPTLDQVNVRGARSGDEVCIYDLEVGRLGCETINYTTTYLSLGSFPDWQPEVLVSPITSRTIPITVTAQNLPVTDNIYARIYPRNAAAPQAIPLTQVSPGIYAGTFNLDDPTFSAYMRVWVDESGQRRESIVDYSLGGNPAPDWAGPGKNAPDWAGPGKNAPVVSSDGQVLLFAPQIAFPPGEFYSLQATTVLPQAPSWATAVGQGYHLIASAGAPDFLANNVSISISYLGSEVPPGEERWLKVYYWDGAEWLILPTQLDTNYNTASALVQGKGLYALMSSLEIALDGPGWTQFYYPVDETRPVGTALASITASFTSVCSFDAEDSVDPWKCYGNGVPDWTNDLAALEYQTTYWIYLTEDDMTLRLKGDADVDTQQSQMLTNLQIPPAIYYGTLGTIGSGTPQPGTQITASVGEVICGQTQTFEHQSQIVYVIDVAASFSQPGCGYPGSTVGLVIADSYTLYTPWDHTQILQLNMGLQQIFLPLINR